MTSDDGKAGMTLGAELVINPRRMRSDLPEFCIDYFDEVLDLRPLAAEVVADYPDPIAVDAETIARLAVKNYYGKYIRVAEFPVGTPREIVQELVWRIALWLHWPRRQAQLKSEQGAFPQRQFTCGDDACRAALAMQNQIVDATDCQRLPLNHCWGRPCRCDYRLVRRDGKVI